MPSDAELRLRTMERMVAHHIRRTTKEFGMKDQVEGGKYQESVERYYFAYRGRSSNDRMYVAFDQTIEIKSWRDVKCYWKVERVMESGRTYPVPGYLYGLMLTVPEMQALMMKKGWFQPEFVLAVDEIYMLDDDLLS